MGKSWRQYNDNGSLTAESQAYKEKYIDKKPFGGPGVRRSPSPISEKSSDTGGGRTSSSRTFDYSAIDEARESRSKAESAKGAAAAAAYAGDVGKTMAAGHAIRGLQQKAREAELQGRRVRQSQSSHTKPNQKSAVKFK
jgi:hypothetical protein